jgi:AcrR family transcriptional regulator
MNKKELILAQAKRLFGQYGYLGFTLKQLASSCDMTAPALYYFYSSKADLFKDCLLSEMATRQSSLARCAQEATTLVEFARTLSRETLDVCGASHFRAGAAMAEIIHLPEAMQHELRTTWDSLVLQEVRQFLSRIYPTMPPPVSPTLLAAFFINVATFMAAHDGTYTQEEFTLLFEAVATGVVEHFFTPSPTSVSPVSAS